MRRFLLAAVMLGAAAGAQAADMPDFPSRLASARLPPRQSTGRDTTSAARAATARPTRISTARPAA